MFKSATIKLSLWYLSMLMVISVLFSVFIYNTTSHEVDFRLNKFQEAIETRDLRFMPNPALRKQESARASENIFLQLVYVNLFLLVAGGFGSYFLARRTMKPIQNAHEAQSRFTSDASHELRTPLASIKTEVEVALKDPGVTKDELKKTLLSNLEEVDNISKLVETLLCLSRLEHDKIKHGPVEVDKVLDSVIKKYRQPPGRIKVKKENGLIAYGNEESISNLFSILLDNAIKYSPDSSVIDISCSKANDHISFIISNFGSGIDQDKLPFVFDRFYRADSSRSKHHQDGYGLGLSIAQRIVQIHGGSLSVTSQKDKLTTFTAVLPSH